MSKASDQNALQRKIFSRWVNQKIQPKGKKIVDVCDDFKSSEMLITLMEALAETDFPHWKKIKTNNRMQLMDNANQALKFVASCGVKQRMPTSAENLVDGDELSVMGLIWAIMLKFMKLDDDDESSTTFKVALQMWIGNQVKNAPYELPVKNMTKCFHDGKVFCALINKFRPKLLDYAAVASGSGPQATLELAFAAAEKYFGLEKYLAWTDIAKLDDKSMVVYASEYYYGIAEQRKVDLACKRVTKLVAFTQENDRLKTAYTERAQQLQGRFAAVTTVLSDTTIENTMAGAVRRLGLFTDYRKNDKTYVFGEAFAMDSLNHTLTRRLLSHKRPEYKAPEGCNVPEIMASLHAVEELEAKQNVALHEELNRQIKLAKIFEQHGGKFKALQVWIAEKKAYLEEPTNILSVGAAKFALNQLEAYGTAFAAVKASIPAFQAWAKELLDNTFEHSATVSASDKEIAAALSDLEAKAATKLALHEDDLAREIVKAKVRGLNADHETSHAKLEKFINAAKDSLAVKETVASIKDAELHLGLTKALHTERADRTANIAPLKAVGAEVLSTEYKSELSQWKFETPEEVTAREAFVEDGFAECEKLGAEKLLVLEDDLARESFKEQVRQWNENHKLQNKSLQAWIAKSKTYVDTKEPCDSVENAQDNLVVHRAYMTGEKGMQENDVKALQEQGQAILTAKYETQYSSYVFGTPEEVKERESSVLEAFVYLNATSAAKLATLEDDLAREEFRFKVNKWNEQHCRQHQELEAWIGESKAYVDTKEPVSSVESAQDNLVVVRAYLGSQTLMLSGDVAALQTLGQQILTAKYESALSQWAFPTPVDVQERETFVTTSFDYLVATSTAKLLVLEDDLAREEFKFKLGLWNDQHVDQHGKLDAWIKIQQKYLAVEEKFDSISDAEKNLKILAAYDSDKADVTKINKAAFDAKGATILEAEYKTELSAWKWESPADVQGRLDFVATSWTGLDTSAAAKKAKLDADLAKEIRKEELRVQWAKLAGDFKSLASDQCANAPGTMFGFVLEEVEAFAATLAAMDAATDASASEAKAKYDPCWAEMIALGVRTPENPYSKLTPDDMEKGQASLAAALAARQARFNTELEKQRADDKACRDLAGAADPFVKALADNKLRVTECKEELEGQLAIIKEVAEKPDAAGLAAILAFQTAVDARAIVYNRHTLNNGNDVEVQQKQYREYMDTKSKMLEAEIEHKLLRGLTREQYDEMKLQFDEFDKDGSGFLDKNEFRSCLYSMGEERGKKEVDAILVKLGNGNAEKVQIAYDGYKEFMIEQLGDTDTEEEVLKGFKLINRQEPVCQWEVMADVLDDPAIEYIKSTHGDNYTEWTKSVFAR